MADPYIDNNHELWNQWTHLHLETASDYQELVERFKGGEILLDETELQEVGDVSGKTMLHLMCHFGLTTLSWARKGAIVTGVDFSEESIRYARAFADEQKVKAEFVCSDIYNLAGVLDRTFDIVYTSGGVLTWLPDLNRWAQLIARYLKPGGFFYLRDSHPFRRVMFPAVIDGEDNLAQYHYFSSEPTRLVMRGSYAQMDTDVTHQAFFWVHGIGEVVSALCSAGLKIAYLHEFPKVYENFAAYRQSSPGKFEMHVLHDWAVPNSFSILATSNPM